MVAITGVGYFVATGKRPGRNRKATPNSEIFLLERRDSSPVARTPNLRLRAMELWMPFQIGQ
jgi:hypothetical protein